VLLLPAVFLLTYLLDRGVFLSFSKVFGKRWNCVCSIALAEDRVFSGLRLEEFNYIRQQLTMMSVQMEEKLNLKLLELLEGRQLSISGLSRELKAEGIDEHRLILTGYLRALRDLEILEEIEVPPSKIYALPEKDKELLPEKGKESVPEKGKELRSPEPSDPEDIYSIFMTQLNKIDLDLKIPVGVYVISRLFERPCFRRELKLVGITQKHLDQYLAKPGMVCEALDAHLKKARADITRIEIPPDDPAYEIRGNREEKNREEITRLTNEVLRLANEVLAGLIKNRIDLEGLVAKSKQTTLLP